MNKMPQNKVLLIYPEVGDTSPDKPTPPFSLLGLGTYVQKAGFQPIIIDARIEKDYLKKVKENLTNDVVCVGISSMSGFPIYSALKICSFVRSINRKIPLVWGGPHPSLDPENTIKNEFVDYVVRGEGEVTFLELLQSLTKGKPNLRDINGLTYKKKKIFHNLERELLDFDNKPMINWQLIDVKKYISVRDGLRSFVLLTSQGCPHRCGFCYKIYGRKWRGFSVKRVVDEIEYFYKDYKIRFFSFQDEEFFTNKNRAKEIFEEIINRKLDIKWEATCRADYIANYEDEFLNLIQKSGCKELFIGAESGSPRILEIMNKDITVDQIIKTVEKTSKYNIQIWLAFMMGIPTETEFDMERTFRLIDYCKTINPRIRVNGISLFNPYKGTPLFDLSLKYGFKPPKTLEEWGEYRVTNVVVPWVTKKEATRLKNISLIARFALEDKRLRDIFKKLSYRLAIPILTQICRIRWRFRLFSFAPELTLIRKVKKI